MAYMTDKEIRQYLRICSVGALILGTAALTYGLIYFKSVLMPLAIASFLYAMISPIMILLQTRYRFPRPAAILTCILGLLVAGALIALILASSVQGFIADINIYEEKVRILTESLISLAAEFHVPVNREVVTEQLNGLPFLSAFQDFSTGVFGFFSTLTLVLIFLVFLFLGSKEKIHELNVIDDIKRQIAQYNTTKTIVSALMGATAGLTFAALQLPLAMLFALMTFLLNFIPNIGPLIAVVMPIPVAVLQFGFGYQLGLVIAIPFILHFLIGNILEPKLMGDSMDLHPITVLIFLVFWGIVWGVAGMVLSVPITAASKIILERFQATKPLAEMLAGRWQEVMLSFQEPEKPVQ